MSQKELVRTAALCPRDVVAGCGGAGKSALSRELGARFGHPVFHLDQLLWKPGWQPDRVGYMARLDEALARERWVMDGNFDSSLPRWLERATDAIFLDLMRSLCLW